MERPGSWAEASIDQVSASLDYGTSAKTNIVPAGIPVLRMGNLVAGSIDAGDLRYLPASHGEFPKLLLRAGDLLFNRTNSPELVGKTAVFSGTPSPCSFASYLIRLRLAPQVEPRYLAWLLNSVYGRRWVKKVVTQQVGQANVNGSKLRAFRFPLAPWAEQQRIVDEVEKQFTRLDAAVAGLQRVKANLKRYRASVLKAACEGRLVPTEAELARREGRSFESGEELLKRILKERRARWEAELLAKMTAARKVPSTDRWKTGYRDPVQPEDEGEAVPGGWALSTVATVGEVLLGRQRAPQYQTGRWTRPYLRVANVKDDRLSLGDVETMDFDPVHFEKYRLIPGDILVSEGQSPERVGESAVYRGGIDGLCFQKTLHRFRPVPGGPSSGFAQIVFRTHVKTGVFMRLASITTNIAHLTLEKFEAAPFPLPPLAEQHRIVAEVERRLSVVDELEATVEKNLARCARLRQSILKMAFEGRLVPQDPNDEPASVLLERIRAGRETAVPDGGPSRRRVATQASRLRRRAR